MMQDRVQRLMVSALGSLALILGAASLEAGGFAISDSDVAAAGMGGTSVARRAGAASQFHNAAGLAFVERPEVSLAGWGRISLTDFEGVSPYPGPNAVETHERAPLLLPAFAYAQPLSPKLVLGLGVDVPFDLQTSWTSPAAFSGRFLAQNASLRCYTATPSVAWRLADRLAIGGGIDLQVATLKVDRRLAAVNPFTMRRVDGASFHVKSDATVGIGYRAGLLVRPSETFSIGVSYRHGAPLDLTGTGTIERIVTGNAQLDNKLAATYPPQGVPFTLDATLPARLAGGFAYAWNDWTFAAEVALERWGSFGSLQVDFEGEPELTTVLARAYEDTHPIRVGVERRVNHAWTVRFGYANEATPMPTESLSPLFFDAKHHRLTLGATFTSGTWRVDVASGVSLFAQRSTEGANPEGFDGTYKSAVPVLGVSLVRGF
jgi:long-chain fatty acid transport protein